VEKGRRAVAGATGSSLTIGSTAAGDAGSYTVEATNFAGTVASNPASLSVNTAPVITSLSPSRQVLIPGDSMNLSVTAASTAAVSYQWLRNGVSLAGGAAATFSLPSVTLQDSGWYQVLVTNTYGTRRSATMFVTVAPLASAVRAWGSNITGETTVPAGLTGAVAISASGDFDFFSLALKRDGTVIGWGSNRSGQSTPPRD